MSNAPHFARGQLLYQQGRYQEALGELQLHLGQHPDDFSAHAMMALCLMDLERFPEAAREAEHAIRIAPDEALGYYALANVNLKRRHLPEAVRAIEEAIRLQPYDADYFATLATIRLLESQWRAALETANVGLEVEPEHPGCTHVRAQALVQLGDRAAAAQTIAGALARRPDDTNAHANQGWAYLHQGQPQKAMEHFREALALDPTNEFARAGIVEAMKARNIIYRWMLGYFLWMSRLPANVQWGLIIGLFIGSRVLRSLANQNPQLEPFLEPILYAYIAFVLMSWLASPLFDLLLRIHPLGRHALFPDQVKGANVLLVCLIVTLGWLVAAIWQGRDELWYATLIFALLSLPASAIYRSESGWPRQLAASMTLVLLFGALLIVVPLAVIPPDRMPKRLDGLLALGSLALALGLLASQFAANYLMNVQVRR